MDVQEVKRQVRALTPEQLDIVIAYVHGYSPQAIEKGLALEAETRPDPVHCQSVAEHSRRRCELDDGHDGAHRSGLVAWGPGIDEPAPELKAVAS